MVVEPPGYVAVQLDQRRGHNIATIRAIYRWEDAIHDDPAGPTVGGFTTKLEPVTTRSTVSAAEDGPAHPPHVQTLLGCVVSQGATEFADLVRLDRGALVFTHSSRRLAGSQPRGYFTQDLCAGVIPFSYVKPRCQSSRPPQH